MKINRWIVPILLALVMCGTLQVKASNCVHSDSDYILTRCDFIDNDEHAYVYTCRLCGATKTIKDEHGMPSEDGEGYDHITDIGWVRLPTPKKMA